MRIKIHLQNLLPQLGCDTATSKGRFDEEVFDDGNGIIEGSSPSASAPFVQGVEEEDVADQLAAAHVLGNVTSETNPNNFEIKSQTDQYLSYIRNKRFEIRSETKQCLN